MKEILFECEIDGKVMLEAFCSIMLIYIYNSIFVRGSNCNDMGMCRFLGHVCCDILSFFG